MKFPRWMSVYLLSLIGPAWGAVAADSAGQAYQIGPAPDWVEPYSPPVNGTEIPVEAGASERFVLADRQIRVDGLSAHYTRFVVRLLNQAGVEAESQLSVNFDPQQDQLMVHSVIVRRGDEVIDELRSARIELLRREQELENGVLTGTVTFHLLMNDVRVGDTIDYSYTINHHASEWGDRYYGRYITRWDNPVDFSRLRILVRAQTPLHILNHDGAAATQRTDGDWQNTEWTWRNLPAIVSDGSTPQWYEVHPSIALSQFASWQDVLEAAGQLYAVPEGLSPELRALVARLKSSGSSDAERALNTVRFVQEEIRYTGLEQGEGAYRPRAPEEVLKRRYGDCKDKALLAVTLLRGLGIEAAPVLVSSRLHAHVRDRQPSPANFDHVIVRVRLGDFISWMDVTLTAQGGTWATAVQPDYGAGLVLAPGSTDLSPMVIAPAALPLMSARALFDLGKGVDHEAALSVSTLYRGAEAERMRRTLRNSTADSLTRDYLNYYKSRYSTISSGGTVQIKDDLPANELTISEIYRIEHPFEDKDGGKRVFELNAENITELLKAPHNPVRSTPLALPFPTNESEQIEIRMPDEWAVTDEVVNISAPGFTYDSQVSHKGRTIFLEYHYRSLDDQIPVTQLTEFLKQREKARSDTYFSLSYKPAIPAADEDPALRALKDALWSRNKGEATQALTTLAQRWPAALKDESDDRIARVVYEAPHAGVGRYKMLKALREAHYTRQDDSDLSYWWRDLGLLQLDRGEPAAALGTLKDVSAPYSLVSIQADNRFAPVRSELGATLDVDVAISRQIEQARAAVTKHPEQIDPVIGLTYRLLFSQRYAEVLQLTDAAIARASSLGGAQAYTDYDKSFVWILDNRSRALLGLGRFDEAVAQLQEASHRPEGGDDNVSQVINLAGLYNDLGRAKEAREALAGLGPAGASAYGQMQVAVEQLNSAAQLDDKAEIERQLKFLSDHRSDSVSTYQRSLVSANRLDDAARFLKSRLTDPEQRIQALMEVQHYAPESLPVRAAEVENLWQAVIGRPDVHDAILKVGAIGSYHLSAEIH